MVQTKLPFFPAHDHGIEDGKVSGHKSGGKPGVRGDGRAARKDGAAKIERIACVGVRSRDGENFLFVEMAGGERTNQQTSDAYERAVENASRRGTREPQHSDRKGIAEAH